MGRETVHPITIMLMSMYNLQRCRSTSDVVSHRLDALLFVASSSGAFPVQPTRHFSVRRVCRQRRSLRLQDGARTADGRSRAQLVHPRDPPLGGADVVRRNGDVPRGRASRCRLHAHGGAHGVPRRRLRHAQDRLPAQTQPPGGGDCRLMYVRASAGFYPSHPVRRRGFTAQPATHVARTAGGPLHERHILLVRQCVVNPPGGADATRVRARAPDRAPGDGVAVEAQPAARWRSSRRVSVQLADEQRRRDVPQERPVWR